MVPNPHDLLHEVVAIARAAGRAILQVYASSFAISEKSDQSPLTEADLRSQEVISAGLRRIAPEIPVLSEEAEQTPFAQRSHWDWLWVVDPLDGTKEFIQRNGEFTVNIALVHAHRPVLGVVHAPVLQRDYYAVEGYGALRVDGDGTTRPIRVRQPPAPPPRTVGSRSHRGAFPRGIGLGPGVHRSLGRPPAALAWTDGGVGDFLINLSSDIRTVPKRVPVRRRPIQLCVHVGVRSVAGGAFPARIGQGRR